MATPAKNHDLHGNVPDTAATVLLLIDVINDFEFEGADEIFDQFKEIAPAVAALKAKAKQYNLPVIYINDNFGKWQSDFQKLLAHCLRDDSRSKHLVESFKPDEQDYFVLKPKHSAFYSTTLDTLLDYLKAKTLILAGIAGNICVLFTASDAFMRDFNLIIPSDCVASASQEDNRLALVQMEKVLQAQVMPTAKIDFKKL